MRMKASNETCLVFVCFGIVSGFFGPVFSYWPSETHFISVLMPTYITNNLL
jgi:hypothetical protein